jgi:hypothetical protein
MLEMEQKIRELAYQKWQEAGCPHCTPEAFWLAAQRDIIAVSLSQMAKVKVIADEATPRTTNAVKASKRRRAA